MPNADEFQLNPWSVMSESLERIRKSEFCLVFNYCRRLHCETKVENQGARLLDSQSESHTSSSSTTWDLVSNADSWALLPSRPALGVTDLITHFWCGLSCSKQFTCWNKFGSRWAGPCQSRECIFPLLGNHPFIHSQLLMDSPCWLSF